MKITLAVLYTFLAFADVLYGLRTSQFWFFFGGICFAVVAGLSWGKVLQ